MNFWDYVNQTFDFIDDNQWLGTLLADGAKAALSKDGEIDYDKLFELAIQESTINSPDIFGPAGSSTSEVDPITGKRTITQTYTPEVQQLFDMLVRNAGSDAPTYAKPDNLNAIQGELINRREDHLGLPRSEYQPFQNNKPRGVSGLELLEDDDTEDD